MSKGRSMRTRHFSGFTAKALGLLGLGLTLASGCNDHTPLGSGGGPEFRGITVPLPPPSFRGATILDLEFSGSAPGFENERVLAWDAEANTGIAGPVDASGNFRLRPWGVNLQRHCIEVQAVNGALGSLSLARYYSLSLAAGPSCQDPSCSVQDSKGECVCLTKRSANCVDAPAFGEGAQAPGTTLAPQPTSTSGGTGSDSGTAPAG